MPRAFRHLNRQHRIHAVEYRLRIDARRIARPMAFYFLAQCPQEFNLVFVRGRFVFQESGAAPAPCEVNKAQRVGVIAGYFFGQFKLDGGTHPAWAAAFFRPSASTWSSSSSAVTSILSV